MLLERGADPVALGRTADEQVVDMAGLVGREVAQLAEAELVVAGRRLAPLPRPLVQLPQEDPEGGGLQLVEARVVADELEVDLVPRAVEAEQPDPLAELRVHDCDETAVAEAE